MRIRLVACEAAERSALRGNNAGISIRDLRRGGASAAARRTVELHTRGRRPALLRRATAAETNVDTGRAAGCVGLCPVARGVSLSDDAGLICHMGVVRRGHPNGRLV